MTGEHDGPGGTSGRDGAEPTRPRTVPLDDLFGVSTPVSDEQRPPAVRSVDPTADGPGEPGPDAVPVPGWDTGPRQVSFAELSGADEPPATVRRATTGPTTAGGAPSGRTAPGRTTVDAARVDAVTGDGAADGPADPAPVRRLTLGELAGPVPEAGTGDGAADGDPGTDRPRVVSFEQLSGRGARRSGPRRERTTPRRRPVTDGTDPADATGQTSATAGAAPDAPDAADPATGTGPRGRRRAEGRGRGSRRTDDPTPRNETPQEQESRARDICLRLLTDRARTVKELGDALRRKEIPEEVAHRVLDRFDEVGLVDDQAFAEQWVRSRHRHRGLGKRAIALELHRKGVDREIADEALTGIDDDSERARARELVVRRLRSLPVGSRDERQASARKLVGMLARKGYGPGVAYGVVKEEIAAAGADAEELGEAPPED